MKLWLESLLNLDKDALHIYGAVLVQLLTAILLRRSLASPLPWIAAFAVTFLNEYLDFRQAGPSERSIALYKEAALHDIWNTLLLPTGLFLIARFWPTLLTTQKTEEHLLPAELQEDEI
ncbi:MAG: hypothetical protein ABJD75_13035 [Parasphingorhabdus sp.]